jgi:hypothetical protein
LIIPKRYLNVWLYCKFIDDHCLGYRKTRVLFINKKLKYGVFKRIKRSAGPCNRQELTAKVDSCIILYSVFLQAQILLVMAASFLI